MVGSVFVSGSSSASVLERPGLGDDIDFDYVREHTIEEDTGAGAPHVY